MWNASLLSLNGFARVTDGDVKGSVGEGKVDE
jgi:hypothetical protein